MKLTKQQLKQIIKEELEKVLKEITGPGGTKASDWAQNLAGMETEEEKARREAEELGFVDSMDDGMRKYAGLMAYKRWVDAGRPEEGRP
jgi:hypothetical protein